jgi:hypothetical protein
MAPKKVPRKTTVRAKAQVAAALAQFTELFRAWGREGGKKGARARWAGVSAKQRTAQAKKAAQARWKRKKA